MFERFLILPNVSLQVAMLKIDELGSQGLVVVDSQNRLVGTLTDGDIRRTLLSGGKITDVVADHCNRSPVFSTLNIDFNERRLLMSRLVLNLLPIIDAQGRVIDVQLHREHGGPVTVTSPVLILAGGRGARLGALTEKTPKPLLKIGGKPLLEILLSRLALQGIKRIYISIHYLGAEIKAAFGDGEKLGMEITYLEEQQPLGTAGSLGLLQDLDLEQPLIITNADLIHNLDFRALLEFHSSHDFDFTLTTAKHVSSIPFGVVKVQNSQVKSIEEKPTREEFINAGIYVIEPKLLSKVQFNQRLEMTNLIEVLLFEKYRVGAFSIEGYWEDVGDPMTLSNVNKGN
jgi:dTDP-glucose pyrophosphorylase